MTRRRLLALAVALLPSSACASRRVAPSSGPHAQAGPASLAATTPAPTGGHVSSPVPVATPSAPIWTERTPVGQIVAARPSSARVFERFGLDYCCGGQVALGDAARTQGVDPKDVFAALSAPAADARPRAERVWTDAPLDELLTHIERTHHVFLREELPRLTALLAKVEAVHGASHPELAEVVATYGRLAQAVPPHLELEERGLFPGVRALALGRPTAKAEVRDEVGLMESQHDEVGAALRRLRELTKGYAVPADACALYRQALDGLVGLEADLHTHVHLENNVVAPQVRALAAG